MKKETVSDSDIREAMNRSSGIKAAAARELGMPVTTLKDRLNKIGFDAKKVDEVDDEYQRVETRDDIEITYTGEEWLDADEIIARSNIDLRLWDVVKIDHRGWESTGKLAGGQEVVKLEDKGDTLKWTAEKLWKSKNRYLKIVLQRKAPKLVQMGILELLKDCHKIPQTTIVYDQSNSSPYFMEISLYDQHVAKYCWAAQTGDNYDLRICEDDYVAAAHDLLDLTSRYMVDKIIIPIGHDFFNSNSFVSTTASGTIVDSTDDRFQKAFRVGCRMVRNLISHCTTVAPVEVIYVPGNHDPATSFYLVEWLSAIFEDVKHVEIDRDIKDRKYRLYGSNLFGYIHGDGKSQPRDASLPLLMATEVPEMWGQAKWKSIRCGHLHKKSEWRYNVGDTFNGVSVIRLPSLTATDAWHFQKGYAKNHRTAEAWLWDYKEGYRGHFSTTALSERQT